MKIPNRYVPILAGRTGEMLALEKAHLGPADAVTPLIDIAAVRDPIQRSEEPPPPANPKKELCALLDRVTTAWSTDQRILIDIEGFAKFHRIDDMHAVEFLAREVDRRGLRVGLAVSTTATAEYRDSALATKELWQDLVIRLGDLNGQNDGEALELAEALNLTSSVTDLVADLRRVDAVSAALVRLDGLIGSEQLSSRWGSVVLASTPLPDWSLLKKPVDGAWYRRHEREIWAQFRETVGPSAVYADYGITGPREDSTSPVGDPSPHLRYTGLDDVWIWKGRKRREGAGPPEIDYAQLCDGLLRISDRTDSRVFRGAGFSWGDEQIEQATRTRRPGIARTWVANSTSHHLQQVRQELAI